MGFHGIYVDYKSMIKENLLSDDNKFVTVMSPDSGPQHFIYFRVSSY